MFDQRVPTVTVEELPDDAYLLDVREHEEWTAGHAPGAHHLPMTELPARLAEVPTEEDVVVVCRSGGRSARVVAYLMQNGWDNVRNLAGGMDSWVEAGRPLVSEDGSAPRVL